MMKHEDIRKSFISYFEKHQHRHIPSSSLIPYNDPTLLFTNAGMNQFKNIFLGSENVDYKRAVTLQKCVRAGGKHNDLDNVGYTTRHHTFFEMMGNFSFGDYFKKDAIHFAWEWITKELAIPKDRLYVTVFQTDDEAADIWHQQEGVPRERILRYGEKDNFWRMGESGPCGPCSEIFYDHGPQAGNPNAKFGEDENRYVEIWNLVFMQYFEDNTGQKTLLPKPSVDTGAGLERITAVMQGKADNYQTDLFTPLIKKSCEIAGATFEGWEKTSNKATLKVIADHARATCFLMADGVYPSNEGRGYVLRRIMRRALRYAQKLSATQTLFKDVCAVCIQEMSAFYPELNSNKAQILKETEAETQKFLSTLSRGTQILEDYLSHNQKTKRIDGKTAFKLYDTFGFPIDLTQLIAREHGVEVDTEEFSSEIEKARQKAKQARKSNLLTANDKHLAEWSREVFSRSGATQFLGYTQLQTEGQKPLAMSNGEKSVNSLKEGESGFVIFESTPFYAESGGQAGDEGEITDGTTIAEVYHCNKQNDVFIHQIHVKSGVLSLENPYQLHVRTQQRRETAKNHSATHLLHAALKSVLGDHVAQAGSLVTGEKLRFDFKNPQAVSESELDRIESLVNEQIWAQLPVQTQEQTYDEAVQSGAVALFGEKYGDRVRVLSMGNFSKELCGGTHVKNTAEIGVFKIVSESSVSAGVRRIEAVTGSQATRYLIKNTQENIHARKKVSLPTAWETYLESGDDHTDAKHASVETAAAATKTMSQWVESAQEQIQTFKKQTLALQAQSIDVKSLLASAQKIPTAQGEIKILVTTVDLEDRSVLSQISDKIRDHAAQAVWVLVGAPTEGSPLRPVLVGADKTLKGIHCGEILKALTQTFGGKGGGRPDFAQGSVEKFDVATAQAVVEKSLKK